MDQNEIKKLVAKYLSEGIELSKIQDILKNKHDANMTFLELRLLASELENIDWAALNPEDETPEEEAPAETDNTDAAEVIDGEPVEDDLSTPEYSGNTTVEVSKLVRPGAVANGSVKFGSGATAEWILDQFGRLSLDKAEGKPTPQDLEEFQLELQKALAGGAV
jgi:hypothetical protein